MLESVDFDKYISYNLSCQFNKKRLRSGVVDWQQQRAAGGWKAA